MTERQELWNVAVEQDGYVTAHDLKVLGLDKNTLAELAHRGKLSREAFGVYRFEEFPHSRAADYRFAVLWTGRPAAVLSHDTALSLLELSDINPPDIHVTVPVGERIRRAGGQGVVVHHEDLDESELGWWEGIRCVKPFTAIRQAIDTHVPAQLIEQAIVEARSRGEITRDQQAVLEQLVSRAR
ncbi:hypothetical protein ET445_07020 [Agromyces protaetiae]|uniref:Type IV toxin-antitoxin system AbiEi family antitoxin domain-containing protein n=1 Tax=Agromyces protaetiae TaxID=2509455 RepID=A0A4P6FBB9_9MICO|nr:type IV toxin-antitoxin system AbiEi family antitoxin domain-containing protein [Agromyces protaetiae]QAY73134.1 hypothetical protein ET445_07020 [Agromyces protaetiae]